MRGVRRPIGVKIWAYLQVFQAVLPAFGDGVPPDVAGKIHHEVGHHLLAEEELRGGGPDVNPAHSLPVHPDDPEPVPAAEDVLGRDRGGEHGVRVCQGDDGSGDSQVHVEEAPQLPVVARRVVLVQLRFSQPGGFGLVAKVELEIQGGLLPAELGLEVMVGFRLLVQDQRDRAVLGRPEERGRPEHGAVEAAEQWGRGRHAHGEAEVGASVAVISRRELGVGRGSSLLP